MTGLLALCVTACSGQAGSGEAGDVLAVHGAIGVVDRGPVDPQLEPLYAMLGEEFQTAYGFTLSQLEALQQHSVETDYPAGAGRHIFTGPLVRDVLAVTSAEGHMLVVTALDGYQREIAMERVLNHDVILALTLDGEPLGFGGFGPTMLVWPRLADPQLAGLPDDDWVWGIVSILVE